MQLTKDGVPVVIHDEKVDRTTNGTLMKVQQVDEQIERAVLLSDLVYEPWHLANKLNVGSIHWCWPMAIPELIDELVNRGLKVRLYTINSETDIRKIATKKIAAIFTDVPELAIAIQCK